MKKNKFKVGDIVEFRKDKYTRSEGKIVEVNSGLLHNSYLVELLGKDKGKGHNGNEVAKKVYPANDYWFVKMNDDSLKLVRTQKEIHITTDGTTTHAILKENGKLVNRAKAVCSPDDSFYFEAGARLALDRLLRVQEKEEFPEYVEIIKTGFHTFKKGTVVKVLDTDAYDYVCEDIGNSAVQYVHKSQVKPLKAVRRIAEKDEYIMLVNGLYSFNKKGDVLKVSLARTNGSVAVLSENHPRETGSAKKQWHYPKCNYIVLEGYEPIEEFVPKLMMFTLSRDINMGKIGTETNMKDSNGKRLYVGDVVEIASCKFTQNRNTSFVCEENGEFFVIGIKGCYGADGYFKDFVVIKKRDYSTLKHLETIGSVKAVLKEEV